MRTDTKIGILLAGLVVAVAAYYFAMPGEEDVRVAGGQQLTDDAPSTDQADPSPAPAHTPTITKSDTPTPVKPGTAKEERVVKVKRTPPADVTKPADDVDALIDRVMNLQKSGELAHAKAAAPKSTDVPAPSKITMPKVAADSATPDQPKQMPQRTDGPPTFAEISKTKITAASASQPPAKPTKIHVVAEGESFASIAERYYGSQRYANFLLKSNPAVKDPRRLFVGTKLNILPLHAGTQSASTGGSSAPKKTAGAGQYRVQKDDTFYGIAARKLGSGERWPEIYELNRDLVGGHPESLRAGQILQLPLASSGLTPE